MIEKLRSYKLGFSTFVIVTALVAIRWILWALGIHGMDSLPLASSVISGGVFVMGLVVSGTLSDYRDAERAPTDVAASLYTILRETESMEKVWGRPNMADLRVRLIGVVTALRHDINDGGTRLCQEAIEELNQTFLELEEPDVPANYIVRLRSEQAALRKSALRIYTIQREEFLPSAKAMITSLVAVILVMLMFSNMGGMVESLVTVTFLGFFFVYLMRLLNVIDKPFKAGADRTGDDVSIFLLTEFVVHATAGDAGVDATELTELAVSLEEELIEIEDAHLQDEELAESLSEVIEEHVQEGLEPGLEEAGQGSGAGFGASGV